MIAKSEKGKKLNRIKEKCHGGFNVFSTHTRNKFSISPSTSLSHLVREISRFHLWDFSRKCEKEKLSKTLKKILWWIENDFEF